MKLCTDVEGSTPTRVGWVNFVNTVLQRCGPGAGPRFHPAPSTSQIDDRRLTTEIAAEETSGVVSYPAHWRSLLI